MKFLAQMNKNVKNLIIPIIIVIVAVLCITWGRETVITEVSSTEDSVIEVNGGDILTQTWMPNNHNMIECTYYIANEDVESLKDSEVSLSIYENRTDKSIAEGIKGTWEGDHVIFNIRKAKMDQGTQYRYELSLNSDVPMYIRSNSNGYGAKLNGVDTNSSLKMSFGSRSFGNFAYAIVLILLFSPVAILIALFTKRTFAETIGLSVLCVGLVLYLFGIFNILSAGVVAVIVLCILAMLGVIVACVMGRADDIRRIVVSPGFIIFSLISILIVFYNSPGVIGLIYGDEFVYWGKAAKDMYYFDSLSAHVNSTVDSNLFRYVPFMTILQYFFLEVAGRYNDAYMYIAYQLASYSLLISALGVLKGDNCKRRNIVVISVILLLIPSIFSNSFYSYIYIDPFLGIMGGYVLFNMLKNGGERFGRVATIIGSMALVLTKEMGCILLVCIAIIVLFDIWDKEENHKFKHLIKNYELHTLIIICVVGMVSFGSYKLYVDSGLKRISEYENSANAVVAEATVQENGMTENDIPENVVEEAVISETGTESITDTVVIEDTEVAMSETVQEEVVDPNAGMIQSGLDLLKKFITGESEEYQRESYQRMFEILFTDPMEGNKFPYIDFMVIVMTLAFLWNSMGKGRNYLLILLGATIGLVVYVRTLFLMYISIFPQADAVRWGSAGRYIDSYMTMVLFAVGSIFIEELVNRKEGNPEGFIVLAFMMGLIIYMAPVNTQLSNHDLFTKNLNMAENRHFPKLFDSLRCVGSEGDRLLYLNMADKEDEVKFGGTMVPFITGSISDSNEASVANVAGYDYVYLQYNSDAHPLNPGLFADGAPIDSNWVYKVDPNNENRLTPIIYAN